MATPTKYLSAKETGVILGMTQRRVNQLAKAGQLESVRIGNSNAIDPESIQKYIKRQKSAKSPTHANGNGHR
jgi:hypothetical protein